MRTPRILVLVAPALLAAASGSLLAAPGPGPAAATRAPQLADDAEPERPPAEDAPGNERILPLAAALARADALIDQGGQKAIGQAGNLLEYALRIAPDSGIAYLNLARVDAIAYARRWIEDDAQIDKALSNASRAVELLPDSPEAHAALATAHWIGEEWDDAIDEAEKAWSLRKETTPAWVTQVYIQTMISRAETTKALDLIEEAMERWPGRANLYALKGAALMDASRFNDAVLDLHRAVYLDPDFAPALLLLGRAYDLSGDRGTASKIYKDITERFPEEKGRVYVLMAITMITRGRLKEAAAGLNDIHFKTKRGLCEGTVIYLKASCDEDTGHTDAARREYRRVIDEYPLASYGAYAAESLASSSYEALARIEIAAGNQDEAARIMEEAMNRPRPNLTLFLRLALLYDRYNLRDDEVAVLRRAAAIDFGPRKAGAKVAVYVAWARAVKSMQGDQAARAEILEALGRHKDALLAAGNVTYFLEAARASALAGDPKAALGWVEQAAKIGYRSLDWIRADPEMKEIAVQPGFSRLAEPAP